MTVDDIKKDIAEIESKIAFLSTRFVDTDKEIKNLMTEIQKREDILKVRKQKEEQLMLATKRCEDQEKRIEDLRKKLNELGKQESA